MESSACGIRIKPQDLFTAFGIDRDSPGETQAAAAALIATESRPANGMSVAEMKAEWKRRGGERPPPPEIRDRE